MSMWDDEAGYDRDDPKHPDFYERAAEWADWDRKLRFEKGEVGDLLAEAERRSMGRSMPFECSEGDVDESGGVA